MLIIASGMAVMYDVLTNSIIHSLIQISLLVRTSISQPGLPDTQGYFTCLIHCFIAPTQS